MTDAMVMRSGVIVGRTSPTASAPWCVSSPTIDHEMSSASHGDMAAVSPDAQATTKSLTIAIRGALPQSVGRVISMVLPFVWVEVRSGRLQARAGRSYRSEERRVGKEGSAKSGV